MSQIESAMSRQDYTGATGSSGAVAQLPAHQAISRVGIDTFIVIDLRPNAATTALSNGDDLLFDLEPKHGFNIKDCFLRLRVSAAGTVRTAPAPYWIKRIRIIANKGSGDTIQNIYPEQIIWAYALMDEKTREWYADYGHTDFDEGLKKFRINAPRTFVNGDVKDILIPFPFSFFHMDAINLQHLNEDIRIRIELNSDMFVSGTATNLTLTACSLYIRQDELTEGENMRWIEKQQRAEHIYNYLDVVRIEENTKTLTASTESKFDLQNIIGKCPYMLVLHKTGTNPTNASEANFHPLEMSKGTLWDLRSPNNESLLGKGNPLRQDYLDYLYVDNVDQKPFEGFNCVQFCHDVRGSTMGEIDNFFEFVGDKDSLSITYDAAPVQEVHTVTLQNAANDGGYYRFAVDGHFSPQLAYNATAATMKGNLENMKPLDDRGYTVTVSGTAEATFTITFGVNDGRVSDEIGVVRLIVVDLNDGTVTEIPSSSVTVYGKRGWTTGSAYKNEIHAYYFKRLTVSQDGRLSCHTL